MKKYPETSVYVFGDNSSNRAVSYLNPKSTQLQETLAVVRRSCSTLGAVSVGCASGTEIDSMLAVADGLFEAVWALGIDKSAQALALAKKGTYTTVFRRPPVFRSVQRNRLERAGFEVTNARYGLDISAETLRGQAQEVTFTKRDITKGALPLEGANLIMCNNVLCCIGEGSEDMALQTANSLASDLADGSVLSLVADPSLFRSYQSENPGKYAAMHKQIAQTLIRDGVEPVVFNAHNAPIAFQRTA